MVSSIQLGNFFTSGGKTVLGGVGGSGLDTESLLKGLVEAKSLPKTQLEDKVELNNKKSSALSEFQTLLGKLKDATNFLRNPPGVGNDADNVFKATTASVSSNTAVPGSSYLSVITSAGATKQNYAISEITQIATAKQQATGTISVADANTKVVYNSAGAGKFQAGTLTINGTDITLSDGDTLNGVAAKFNAASESTGIRATVIQEATGSYQLFFAATKTGTANSFNLNDIQSVGNPTGTIEDPDGVLSQMTITNKQGANNAEFIINGITIIRSTNSVTDVIDGVTFNLLQATPEDTELSVNVGSDDSLVKSGIINFANVYNDLKVFAAKQLQLGNDGLYTEDSLLHDNQTFRSTMDSLATQLTTIVSGITGSNPNRLADIGITLTDLPASDDAPETKNIITVDEGKLTTAIASNPEGVRRLFEFDFQSTNPNMRVYSRANTLGVASFSLNINPYATQTTKTFSLADSNVAAAVSSSPGDGLFKAGTLSIAGQDITLVDGDTLDSVISKFNAVEGTTGLHAALNTVAAGQYSITFTSTVTSGSVNFNLKDTDSVDTDGVFDEVSVTATGEYTASYTLDGEAETVDLDVTAVGSTGYSIKGKAGTALEGLVLIYSSKLSTSADVTTTQGIADKLYNISANVLKENTGALAVELDAIKTNNDRLDKDISRLDDQIEVFRNQLLLQFSELEKAISQVNTLLQSIDANNQAYYASNS